MSFVIAASILVGILLLRKSVVGSTVQRIISLNKGASEIKVPVQLTSREIIFLISGTAASFATNNATIELVNFSISCASELLSNASNVASTTVRLGSSNNYLTKVLDENIV